MFYVYTYCPAKFVGDFIESVQKKQQTGAIVPFHFSEFLQLTEQFFILIQNTLENAQDAARLLLIMAAKNTRVIVAYNTWVGGEDGNQLQQLLQ